MPSKTISQKNPQSPLRIAAENKAASLLGTLSKTEISLLLNLRSLDNDYLEMIGRMAQNLFDESLVKSRPSLSIVRTASITSIGGGRHV